MSYSQLRTLGQVTTTTESVPLSDGTKVAIGLGAFAVLGGLGYLAYKYPMPSFGGGYGAGPYMDIGRSGGGPGLSLRFNGRRRRHRRPR